MRADEPHFVVWVKGSGVWALPMAQLERFRTELASTTAWYDGPDLYDSPCLFRYQDVRGVLVKTDASIALLKAEADAENAANPPWK